VPGVDDKLGLTAPRHTADGADHNCPAIAPASVKCPQQVVNLRASASESGQVRRQPVLDADLRGRPGPAAENPQRLPPLSDVAGVRMQRLHHRNDQLHVEPPPAGPETVHDRRLAGQVTGRPPGGRPRRVDPIFDRFVRRVTRPHLQPPQPLDKSFECVGLPRVG